MRTAKIVLVVAALGTATLMWSMSGFGGLYGQTDPISGSPAGGVIEEQGNESAVANGSFSGSASASDDSIVGLIISGTSTVIGFAGMIALLPLELQRLGFPFWFATPLGLIAQALVGIGIVQFAAGREWY